MRTILKAEGKAYKLIQETMPLNMTNALIRAVEKVRFAKTDFRQTHFFNGSDQRVCHTQRQLGSHVLVGHTLSFQKRHHLCL